MYVSDIMLTLCYNGVKNPSGVVLRTRPTVKWRSTGFLLIFCAIITHFSEGTTDLGGNIVSFVTLEPDSNPYVVRNDLIVEDKGVLLLKPGVIMKFLPSTGITVRGKLLAEGDEGNRILMTSASEPSIIPPLPSIRLVDGPSPISGRLQILHKGKWRSVCTNSRNWTISDMEVACRQLGFQGGEWSQWYDHYNTTRQMLYEKPTCHGKEDALQQCQWDTRQVGSGVCNHHPDLGLQCSPYHGESTSVSSHFWRGLRFENAIFRKELIQMDTLYVKYSDSALRYLEIRYAGNGLHMNVTSAVEAIGVPPRMQFVTVKNSAYNGLNLTSPGTVVDIQNSSFIENRGYGIYINTSDGMCTVLGSNITANGAAGIKYIFNDRILQRKADVSYYQDFCTFPVTSGLTYPVFLAAEVSIGDRLCTKSFHTKDGFLLTVHFEYMYTGDESGSAVVKVRDGSNGNAPLLTSWEIKNDTWPQSVVSTKNYIYLEYQPHSRTRTMLYFRVTAGPAKAYDLKVSDSIISDNNGPGLKVENLRRVVNVHGSVVKSNTHAAGIYVVDGAGDVNVTHSNIAFNQGDGMNITYSGGSRNISWSSLAYNEGRGMVVWFNTTSNKIPYKQETIVAYTDIISNHLAGILVGNYCGEAIVNISGNTFNESKSVAVDIQSCWKNVGASELLHVQIGNNRFFRNEHLSIRIHPPANMYGHIDYNLFHSNHLGCILIKGVDVEELESLPVDLILSYNWIEWNDGVFAVSLGVSQYSIIQHLLFTQNFVRNNTISEPYPVLNPRSQSAAAIVVSSPYVIIFRNIIDNVNSKYEIGSHLQDQSYEINGTYNWLGAKEESVVYYRVFDRKDRYNLAKVRYFPYLLKPNSPNTELVNIRHEYEGDFQKPGTNEIGGEITGQEQLIKDGVYIVKRDITIRPGGSLTITYGVTLKFEPSLGMMVAGKLQAEGYGLSEGKYIKFTLLDNTRENVTEHNVKLVGGKTSKEGRLQVQIGNTWGTVCNYNFDINDAAVVCHQLGLVLNPDDWLLERADMPIAGTGDPVILSNVQCSDLDFDITRCPSETRDEFENSCTHENDVGLRCYDSSWAGIRFGMTAEKSVLQFAYVEKAGLLDYSINKFKPAIQVDFSHHVLHDIHVVDNIHDGLHVVYSDIYYPDKVNIFANSEFSRNFGNGFSVQQLGMTLLNCMIQNNRGSGISQDPVISRIDQREMAGWVASTTEKYWTKNIALIPDTFSDVILEEGQSKVFVTQRVETEQTRRFYITSKSQSHVLGIQLLNPLHNESTESLLILDMPAESDFSRSEVESWDLRRDQVAFPTISSSFGITVEYNSGPKPRGQAILVVTSVPAPAILKTYSRPVSPQSPQHIRSTVVQGPIPTLKIDNCKIKRNGRGISSFHYNRYLSDFGDVYLRKANESIEILESEISYNNLEAVYYFAPYSDIYFSNISEIKFMMNRSLITDNGRGIKQYSKDLRGSNNLFHWVMADNTVERNDAGGFQIALPYVWQYNENHTHLVFMLNNTFRNNRNVEITIDGHFAKIEMRRNVFTDNQCKEGLVSIRGMEKEMLLISNHIELNRGDYMVEFNTDSQSAILGEVQAYFVQNVVRSNQYLHMQTNVSAYQPASYVIGLKGIQKVNVTNNIFSENVMDYELLAGIRTARLDNYVNVAFNWWGTLDEQVIREKIFDFDDWNCYAIANYRPYFQQGIFNGPQSNIFAPEPQIDLENLGGRLTQSLVLHARDTPYIIRSDLTVMPDVTLTIVPGAILEFFPSVGILVLGSLWSQGNIYNKIVMRPVKTSEVTHFRLGRSVGPETVRLCIEGTCERNSTEGFLEFYNLTTMQWVPVCDVRFMQRNAEVICRQLGFDYMDPYIDFGRRIEYHYNSLDRIRYWPEPYQCKGYESRIEDCQIRVNAHLFDYNYRCDWEANFVFLRCGERNLDRSMEYWGGIRFAVPTFEQLYFGRHMHDVETHHNVDTHKVSILEYVDIVGAGILHNEKSPAVQAVARSPIIRSVNITNSSSDAVNLVSAPETMKMLFNRFENNLGIGISAVSLTGEAGDLDSSSFLPLRQVRIPYHIFGMMDMCDTTKEIDVVERVLLYYKYDNFPVDCVKIFSNAYSSKTLGFRLLQFNLYNSSGKPWPPDSISLYDGDIYNYTAQLMVKLTMDKPIVRNRLHRTWSPSLSIKLHATGASQIHGFIAEVITLPVAPYGIDRNVQFNITYSILNNNERGAVYYGSAGEVNPLIAMEWSQFDSNCLKLYGNFTTCDSALHLDVQNTPHFLFKNNLVRNNQGGLYVLADSGGSATSMKAYLKNNLFTDNSNREVLHLEGRRSSPYQEVTLYRNYITRSYAPFNDTIVLNMVVANLTFNYIHNNLGFHIMQVSGFNNVRLPVYQTSSHNSFYRNHAFDWRDRGTIFAQTAGQQYVDNVMVNPDNDYEIVTANKSTTTDYLDWEDWRSVVDCQNNWWGYNHTLAVQGRIKDQYDNRDLIPIIFEPYLMNNRTVLSGKCPPSWTLVGDTCYLYIGGPMKFQDAKEFCKMDNSSMPYVMSNYQAVSHFLHDQQENFHYYDMVWVQHIDMIGDCTVFVDESVKRANCEYLLPFLCETDPKVYIDPLGWTDDVVTIAAISVTGVALLLIILVLCFWCSKSRKRKLERLERRNSIRTSLRSLASTSGLSDSDFRKRMIAVGGSKPTVAPSSRMSDYNKMNGSMESLDKTTSQMNSSVEDSRSYDIYETHNMAAFPDLSDQYSRGQETENEPSEMGYKNPAYQDASTYASRDVSQWSSQSSNLTATGNNLNSGFSAQPKVGGFSSQPNGGYNNNTNGALKNGIYANIKRGNNRSAPTVVPVQQPSTEEMEDFFQTRSDTLPLHPQKYDSISSQEYPENVRDYTEATIELPYTAKSQVLETFLGSENDTTPSMQPYPRSSVSQQNLRPTTKQLLETNFDNPVPPARTRSVVLETHFDVAPHSNYSQEHTMPQENMFSRSKSQPLETAM